MEQFINFFRKISYLILLFISSVIQAKDEIRVLTWIPDTNKLLFSGAQYISNHENLPFYIETFYLDQPSSINVKIKEIIEVYKNFNYNIEDTFKWYVYSGLSRGKYFYQLIFLPIKRNSYGALELVRTFEIKIETHGLENQTVKKSILSNQNSVLSSGRWYRLKIKQDGIYKISYSQIKSWGFTKMHQIQIYGMGGGMLPTDTRKPYRDDLMAIPIYIEKGNDGVFNEGDYILFYAQGANVWKFNTKNRRFYHEKHQYSDYNYYFITDEKGISKEITNAFYDDINTTLSVMEVNTFDDYYFFESDETNFLHSGRVWYGNPITNQTTKTFSTTFSNLNTNKPVFIYYDILSVADAIGEFSIKTDGVTITKKANNNTNIYYFPLRDTLLTNINSNTFKIDLSYSNLSSSAM